MDNTLNNLYTMYNKLCCGFSKYIVKLLHVKD